ncbi:hypothetical protein FALBO_14333 [Fusarium albosuccineum]|uniref:Enoyl reductase (ER) domain-containing protein n=1 Tax=Fusarium albosuccineum TaxID=1237068 RepID=A0A8H4KX54_9HYPO|nr:hypothetical protein FALBO_14333 [Fusarium albosuccineum]
MKGAFVSRGPKVEIIDSPIPTPGPRQVLIRTIVSGSNPKDWKMSEYYGIKRFNTGDDIAGIVHSVGSEVVEFKPGDRVAAMHELGSPGGSYAEYSLSPVDTTFHIPKNISFEEAATIPLAALTAAVLLFRGLELPDVRSTESGTEKVPFVVYGAASAVGAFAIQLAQHRGIHPIIAVAGRGILFAEKLLDKSQGDAIVDYRLGDDAVVAAIRTELHGAPVRYALDAVRAGKSYINLAKILDVTSPGAKLALVLPLPGSTITPADREASHVAPPDFPAGITPVCLGVTVAQNKSSSRDAEFGYIHSRLLGKGLADGWLKPHPHEVQSGGLDGLEKALENLKQGQASATKYVFRLADTDGAEPS